VIVVELRPVVLTVTGGVETYRVHRLIRVVSFDNVVGGAKFTLQLRLAVLVASPSTLDPCV
jgi:hypothetical protein